MQGMTKKYPGCIANNGVTLKIKHGEVHALLGENGAGKSTLMKMLYGVVKPDQGDMFFNGRIMNIKQPADARDLGIGMVFQHFSLFETLTVAQNIELALGDLAGHSSTLAGRITKNINTLWYAIRSTQIGFNTFNWRASTSRNRAVFVIRYSTTYFRRTHLSTYPTRSLCII